jgi:single-strand DNA-binding protein
MAQVAEFEIIGRIAKFDAKEKVTFVDIASSYPRQENDEWVDDTHWNRVTFFGNNIERIMKNGVGDLVRVVGRVRQSQYERDGEQVYVVDLIAERSDRLAKKFEGTTGDR